MPDDEPSHTTVRTAHLDAAFEWWTALDRDWKAVILGTLALLVVVVS